MRFLNLGTASVIAAMVWGLSYAMPSRLEAGKAGEWGMFFADDTPVWDVLAYFGKVRLNVADTSLTGVSAARGQDIVHQGFTTDASGKKTKRQSKAFTCVACHNAEREFADLADISPNKRLDYAVEKELPFVQGSSFFGLVNRVTYFNGDYQQQFGAGAGAARADLRKAIQLCATEGAKGRALEAWELESVLAYMWTLQLKLSDLTLDADQREKIEFAVKEKSSLARAVNIIEDEYIDAMPAKFVEPMSYRTLDSQLARAEDRIARGGKIYKLACQHCHGGKRYSKLGLDSSAKTFKKLTKHLEEGHPYSVYKIVRQGSYQAGSKKAYMPRFTAEKLSDEQLIDLRIYIEHMAKQ